MTSAFPASRRTSLTDVAPHGPARQPPRGDARDPEARPDRRRSAAIRPRRRPIPTAIASAPSCPSEQIDALPDDPDEMERVLKEMAGPGGDAFASTASAAASCRRNRRSARSGSRATCSPPRTTAAAWSSSTSPRSPASGRCAAGFDLSFRDDSLNARNAFLDEKGQSRQQQYTLQSERHAAARSARRSRCRPAARRSTTRRTSTPPTGAGTPAAAVRRPIGSRELQRTHRSRAHAGRTRCGDVPAERRTISAISALAAST